MEMGKTTDRCVGMPAPQGRPETDLRSLCIHAESVRKKTANAAERLDRLKCVLFGTPAPSAAKGTIEPVPDGLYSEIRSQVDGTDRALDAIHEILDRLDTFA